MYRFRKPLRWKFHVETPGEDGEFILLVRRPSLPDKVEVKNLEGDSKVSFILQKSVVGWEGLVEETGDDVTPVPFSHEAFGELMGNDEFANDLVGRLIELWYGVPAKKEESEKNSKTPSTASSEA